MRIAFINGSPKVKNSASGALLEDLKGYFSETNEILDLGFHTTDVSETVKAELSTADAWVFAFPLYVDGIPGHLLSCLVQLEEICIHNPQIQVYGIVNCGFYEGIQAEYSQGQMLLRPSEPLFCLLNLRHTYRYSKGGRTYPTISSASRSRISLQFR